MIDNIYKEKYVDHELLNDIKNFYSTVNDTFSGGPFIDKGELGIPGLVNRRDKWHSHQPKFDAVELRQQAPPHRLRSNAGLVRNEKDCALVHTLPYPSRPRGIAGTA